MKDKLTFEQECKLIANGEDLPEEKQIEEMGNCVTCMHYYYCYRNQKAYDNGEVARANLFKEVEEQGCEHYTHEDSVVLSREEYERLKRVEAEKDRLYEIKLDLENQLIEKGWTDYEGADEIEKRVSKETAEKIKTGLRSKLVYDDKQITIKDKYIIGETDIEEVIKEHL